jgi:hypothetical protein
MQALAHAAVQVAWQVPVQPVQPPVQLPVQVVPHPVEQVPVQVPVHVVLQVVEQPPVQVVEQPPVQGVEQPLEQDDAQFAHEEGPLGLLSLEQPTMVENPSTASPGMILPRNLRRLRSERSLFSSKAMGELLRKVMTAIKR